jgi:dTDP-4-dehydrorhamnose 3,5-epimerase
LNLIRNSIPGCYEIYPKLLHDDRGVFVKTYHKDVFEEFGIGTVVKEQYYSKSKKGVLRGLHFQTPPHDHEKIVYCTEGEVLDVVVDLRKESPTFGTYQQFILSSEKGNIIYIPTGLAHGFYVLSDNATMIYNVSSVYSPESDRGIHWRSVGIDWPDMNPLISQRDDNFSPLSKFESPFYYKEVNIND